jgi:hypothetical protein
MSDKIIFGHDLANVYNINESLVTTLIEKTLSKDKSLCSCGTCVEDMFSLSLYSEKMEQAVEKAVYKVSKHHNHT